MSFGEIENFAKALLVSKSKGTSLDMGIENMNIPLIYKQHMEELRSKIFAFRDIYTKNAQVSKDCILHKAEKSRAELSGAELSGAELS